MDEQQSLEPRIKRALFELRKRGPDDQGYEIHRVENNLIALGHTRLSIIDLSSSGHQPMRSANGVVSIVFNGEIYNYRELSAELRKLGHQFESASDTEVLLAAWMEWGAECLSRLTGMFAFVVFDRSRRTLTCVRDAFGIKPFFYSATSRRFVFASEIKALTVLNGEDPVPDWQSAYDYLVHGDYDSGPQTFFAGVNRLMPGHLMVVDLTKGVVNEPECWWRPNISQSSSLSFDAAVDELRERFLESIRLHLRSDVPLGTALSGGVDSSAIVCAMRYLEPDIPINTFSYVVPGDKLSEEAWVDRINQHVGALSHKVFVKPNELVSDLDDMIQCQGEPFGSTSIYAQYRVYRRAKEKGITVTLDGQGADELLAGYIGYPGQRVRSLIDNGNVIEAWRFLRKWSAWPDRSLVDGVKRTASEVSSSSLYALFRQINGRRLVPKWINENAIEGLNVVPHYPRHRSQNSEPGRRVVAALANSLTKRGVPKLLRHGDRNSMQFSVESRVPFLTVGIANFLLSVPEDYLISAQGETKFIFRAAMRGIVPDEVLDRRDKIGFITPENAWLLSISNVAKDWIKDGLPPVLIDKTRILKEFEMVVEGKKAFSQELWRWINYSRWYKLFF